MWKILQCSTRPNKKKFASKKELLQNRLHEKDVLVKILKEQSSILKEKNAQKKKACEQEAYTDTNLTEETVLLYKNEEEELFDLIESICREDNEIVNDCFELEEIYNGKNEVGIGGAFKWLF